MLRRFRQVRHWLWQKLWLVSQGDYLFLTEGSWEWKANPLFDEWSTANTEGLLAELSRMGGKADD